MRQKLSEFQEFFLNFRTGSVYVVFMKFKFLKSAVFPEHYPAADRFEVMVSGRSNAGKSSFLNALAGGAVAKVSQKPGKTTLLNFFDVGEHYRIVDTPGYGYSSRSGEEQASWQMMMEQYMSLRGNLKGVLLLMDFKRDWEQEEELLLRFCNKIGIPMGILLTKADRGKEKEIKEALQRIKNKSKHETIFAISSEKKMGIFEVEEFVFKEWIKPFLQGHIK
jgi:GTP-binding protein